jgi:hypothetical protein
VRTPQIADADPDVGYTDRGARDARPDVHAHRYADCHAHRHACPYIHRNSRSHAGRHTDADADAPGRGRLDRL